MTHLISSLALSGHLKEDPDWLIASVFLADPSETLSDYLKKKFGDEGVYYSCSYGHFIINHGRTITSDVHYDQIITVLPANEKKESKNPNDQSKFIFVNVENELNLWKSSE